MPTISANNIASSVYSSLEGSTIWLKTLDTKSDTNATGPTASWRDDPNIAYMNIGTNPESVQKMLALRNTAYYTWEKNLKNTGKRNK